SQTSLFRLKKLNFFFKLLYNPILKATSCSKTLKF
ncbi:hypothetical protein NEOC65_002356, partial [Neochlamydia sp. AcF65]|nr:hypothetical protein [Neochlamydia sp. AcF65]MBS4166960.1 hypothetical protein [Neochlamydia sp. AcF65]MBS4167250.1 hypothetical protein [Neochlamydia sp. AcF65]